MENSKREKRRKQLELLRKKKVNDENRATKKNISTEDEDIGLILVSTDEEDSENDAQCLYCKYFFSEDKRGEKWVRCTKCYGRCHECASGREDWTHFTCSDCLDN
jgi:hypothetical protein